MSYPPFIDGKPPVISLADYDAAPWAAPTCLDFRNNQYVVVVMETPEQQVAVIARLDYDVLNRIFLSAHAKHAEQQA